MKKTLVLMLAVMTCMARPLFGQEKQADTPPAMRPPTSLADDFCTWMVGEWEGWTTSAMGKSQDWQKVEWGLDNQFIITHYTSKTVEANPEAMQSWAQAMNMSKEDMDKMMNMTYKGMGTTTINPASGEFMGYWFDNWRGIYKGSGKREGNKLSMMWEGAMGAELRTIEKISEDKSLVTFSYKDASGKVMEGRTELTRKR